MKWLRKILGLGESEVPAPQSLPKPSWQHSAPEEVVEHRVAADAIPIVPTGLPKKQVAKRKTVKKSVRKPTKKPRNATTR